MASFIFPPMQAYSTVVHGGAMERLAERIEFRTITRIQNGTTDGTAMVMDINPGSEGSWPSYLGSIDNVLYFKANDGVHGDELWSLETVDLYPFKIFLPVQKK
jgi:hypothetical protein